MVQNEEQICLTDFLVHWSITVNTLKYILFDVKQIKAGNQHEKLDMISL